jgi:nicotinic acid mononucleotide adenylyltransferase
MVNRDEVSSTEIRARIAAGQPWRYLVPDAILTLADGIYSPLAK